jgi:murein L,D-transpeptidase YafK
MTLHLRFILALLVSVSLMMVTGCESVSSTSKHPKTAPRKIVKLPTPSRADRVVIEKSKRTLTAYAGKQPLATFKVALGRDPVGPKTCKGDYRTPEGHYKIIGQNPVSNFYRSLRINYPNAEDIANAKKKGCDPGGDIVIHGLQNGYDWVGRTHCSVDWTSGCIAVTNQEMDYLWKILPVGTPVEIRS